VPLASLCEDPDGEAAGRRNGGTMILRRREFLQLLGLGVGAAGLGCDAFEWFVPDRLVEQARRGPGLETHRNTPCGLCEGACGMTVRVVDGLPVGVKGNARHPLNRGGLCPVGLAALDLLYAPTRLRGPLRRDGEGALEPVSWQQALGEIAGRLRELRGSGRGDRVVFVSEEPSEIFHQLLIRFAGLIGSRNVTRPREPEALPFTLMQGLDEAPGFDLGRADLVLSFGLDIFEDGPTPVQAIVAMVGARRTEERAELIHVGTRLSPSAAKADLHIPVQPGTHGALALGVAHVLVREGAYDRRFVAEHTSGFEDWTDAQGRRRLGFRRLLLERYYPDRVAGLCGCEAAQVVRVARRFAAATSPIAVAGGEATNGSNGTWTAMAVHALNALVGAFDRDGGIVLPAPMALSPLTHPRQVAAGAQRPLFATAADATSFGLDAVETLAERVVSGSYPVEALIVIGSNPVYSSPAGHMLREAMGRIPMTVVLAPFRDETASTAQFVLPTSLFLEAWNDATTPSCVPFSVLGIGAPVLAPLHDTRHAGDVLLEMARLVGDEGPSALPWTTYADYLQERVRGLFLSGQGAVVSGSFAESWVQFLEERGWRFLEHGDRDLAGGGPGARGCLAVSRLHELGQPQGPGQSGGSRAHEEHIDFELVALIAHAVRDPEPLGTFASGAAGGAWRSDSRYRSASSAAMQPVPAAVTAWR